VVPDVVVMIDSIDLCVVKRGTTPSCDWVTVLADPRVPADQIALSVEVKAGGVHAVAMYHASGEKLMLAEVSASGPKHASTGIHCRVRLSGWHTYQAHTCCQRTAAVHCAQSSGHNLHTRVL